MHHSTVRMAMVTFLAAVVLVAWLVLILSMTSARGAVTTAVTEPKYAIAIDVNDGAQTTRLYYTPAGMFEGRDKCLQALRSDARFLIMYRVYADAVEKNGGKVSDPMCVEVPVGAPS